MSNVEWCGCDYGIPHVWQEGPAQEPEIHRCPGYDPREDDLDIDSQDELFERGGYDQ